MGKKYESSRGGGGRDRKKKIVEVEMDLTPMVDLAFLLLTFFMLTTTFSKPQAMEVRMPVKPDAAEVEQTQPVKESHAITLLLDGEDKVYWYQGVSKPVLQESDYTAEGIRELLFSKNQEIPKLVVLIKPTENSSYSNLVDILDEMSITQTQRFAIVDVEERDLDLLKEAGK